MNVHGRDLRYFVAVAEEGHVTRAAERLYVSQPALSKQVRMLERQLGAELFERGPRGVSLTPVGAALLPHAQALLAAWESAERDVEQAKLDQRAELVVGMSTGIGRGLLPAVRSRFSAAQPRANPTLRQVSWRDPTGGLADRSSDVAFVWLPLPDPAPYRWVVVAEEPRHVALPETHPMAARDTVAFADLLDEPFLALPESAGALREHWLATDARGGHPVRIGGEICSLDETYEALLDGRGVCLLAAGNAPLLAHDGVVTRPVIGLGPSRLALAHRGDDTRPLVLAYVQACREAVSRAI